jgi:hypothetical protein
VRAGLRGAIVLPPPTQTAILEALRLGSGGGGERGRGLEVAEAEAVVEAVAVAVVNPATTAATTAAGETTTTTTKKKNVERVIKEGKGGSWQNTAELSYKRGARRNKGKSTKIGRKSQFLRICG